MFVFFTYKRCCLFHFTFFCWICI